LRTPALLLCLATAACAFPAHADPARDCVAANARIRPAICAASDLDGDRLADYAISRGFLGSSARHASISVHLSSTPDPYLLLLPDGLMASSFVFRDVDGDGRLDIALLGGLNETVGVFLNAGSGRFEFDREGRYLTAPSRDSSALAPPSHPALNDLAELGSNSYSAVCSGASALLKLPAACVHHVPGGAVPLRRPRGAARSRAP